MKGTRRNRAVVKVNPLKVLRKESLKAQLRARKQWREFDATLLEVEKLGRDVSKVSRHALLDIVARFRKFRQPVATSTHRSRSA